jgi:hypothetical protein
MKPVSLFLTAMLLAGCGASARTNMAAPQVHTVGAKAYLPVERPTNCVAAEAYLPHENPTGSTGCAPGAYQPTPGPNPPYTPLPHEPLTVEGAKAQITYTYRHVYYYEVRDLQVTMTKPATFHYTLLAVRPSQTLRFEGDFEGDTASGRYLNTTKTVVPQPDTEPCLPGSKCR